jgi:hypothetical protein
VALPGKVRELGSPAGGGQIKDLSIGGCRIREHGPAQACEIWITLGNAQPMRARVVWVGSGEAGCEFYAPPAPLQSSRHHAPTGRSERGDPTRRAQVGSLHHEATDPKPEAPLTTARLNETIAG